MIARLRGALAARSPEAVIVDVAGVGYQVALSLTSFCQLPSSGQEVILDIHTHVREDQISLYGFLVPGEKDVFRLLIGISGIGPRLALNILSGISPAELADAIAGANLRRLQAIPGVGKKTAERILIELKDKLLSVSVSLQSPAVRPAVNAPYLEDLTLALTTLGYRKPEVDQVIHKLPMKEDASLEQLIRDALRLLTPKTL